MDERTAVDRRRALEELRDLAAQYASADDRRVRRLALYAWAHADRELGEAA